MASKAAAAVKKVARSGALLGARATSGAGLLPSFLIVGGKRCGSTSLYEYVIRHPAVLACRVKKGTHFFDVNYAKGWNWYRAQFPTRLSAAVLRRTRGLPDAITGEASPYYMFHPLAPLRIAEALPDARLIAVLRDPVERAWSHYQYSVRRGFEHLPVDEALDREAERLADEEERIRSDSSYRSSAHRHHTYLARGRYADQLETLYALFPPDQVLVLKSEDLFTDPNRALGEVFRFLGLEPVALRDLPAYKAGAYAAMPEALRARLEAYYEEPNRRLSALPGVNLTWEREGA